MLIIGAKETETETVSVRLRENDQTVNMTLDEFLEKVTTEIQERK